MPDRAWEFESPRGQSSLQIASMCERVNQAIQIWPNLGNHLTAQCDRIR
jgi:hypothetical protein